MSIKATVYYWPNYNFFRGHVSIEVKEIHKEGKTLNSKFISNWYSKQSTSFEKEKKLFGNNYYAIDLPKVETDYQAFLDQLPQEEKQEINSPPEQLEQDNSYIKNQQYVMRHRPQKKLKAYDFFEKLEIILYYNCANCVHQILQLLGYIPKKQKKIFGLRTYTVVQIANQIVLQDLEKQRNILQGIQQKQNESKEDIDIRTYKAFILYSVKRLNAEITQQQCNHISIGVKRKEDESESLQELLLIPYTENLLSSILNLQKTIGGKTAEELAEILEMAGYEKKYHDFIADSYKYIITGIFVFLGIGFSLLFPMMLISIASMISVAISQLSIPILGTIFTTVVALIPFSLVTLLNKFNKPFEYVLDKNKSKTSYLESKMGKFKDEGAEQKQYQQTQVLEEKANNPKGQGTNEGSENTGEKALTENPSLSMGSG